MFYLQYAREAYGGFEVDEGQSTQCVSWQRVGKAVNLWGVRVGDFKGS